MSAAATRSNPYQGLVPFEEQDAPFFFGRDRETSRILSNVIASRLTLLYGPSGVGKSSVLNAGVAHQLRAMTAADVADGLPPAHAVVSFGAWSGDAGPALLDASRRAIEAVADGPLPAPDGPGLAAALRAWTGPDGFDGALVLLLDQFEELFVYHDGDPESGGVGAELAALLARDGGAPRVHVLLSFREDALAQLDVFKRHVPGLFDTVLRIEPLTAEAAAAAITGPVERYNETAETPVAVEPALVEAVLHDVETGRIALATEGQGGVDAQAVGGRIELPFLQLVLTRLWERERALGSDTLRLATYADDLGGAEAIIRSHLDGALAALTLPQRDVAADVFRYLVTPSGTKYAMGSADLARFAGQPEAEVRAVLDALSRSDRRVLRRIPPPQPGGEATFEVAHDRLGAAVLEWRARHLSAQQAEAERDAAAKALADTRRRAAGWVGIAAVIAAVAVAGFWYQQLQNNKIEDANKKLKQANRQLDELIKASRRAGYLTSADGRFVISLAAGEFQAFDTENITTLDTPADLPDSVAAVALDPADERIALASRSGAVQIRSFPDLRTISVIPTSGVPVPMHAEAVQAVAFSLDGDTLATGGADRTVRLWDARADPPRAERTGRLYNVIQYPAPVVALSPEGDGCTGGLVFCARGSSGEVMPRCTQAVEVVVHRRTTNGYRAAVRHALELEIRDRPSTMYKHHLGGGRLRTVVGPFCTRSEAERVAEAIRTDASARPSPIRWANPAGWTRARVVDLSGAADEACNAPRFEGLASNRPEAGPAFECDPLEPR